jgi:hypothetical protein
MDERSRHSVIDDTLRMGAERPGALVVWTDLEPEDFGFSDARAACPSHRLRFERHSVDGYFATGRADAVREVLETDEARIQRDRMLLRRSQGRGTTRYSVASGRAPS